VPCYQCGSRQVDPEPGKPTQWHRGVLRQQQVLICPDCYPAARPDLTRCLRCERVHLVKRLGQLECQDCHQVSDAAEADGGHLVTLPSPAGAGRAGSADTSLADEVDRALARLLGPR
jgi:hypothetical protein